MLEKTIMKIFEIFMSVNEDTLARTVFEVENIEVFILRNGTMRSTDLRISLSKLLNEKKIRFVNGVFISNLQGRRTTPLRR